MLTLGLPGTGLSYRQNIGPTSEPVDGTGRGLWIIGLVIFIVLLIWF